MAAWNVKENADVTKRGSAVGVYYTALYKEDITSKNKNSFPAAPLSAVAPLHLPRSAAWRGLPPPASRTCRAAHSLRARPHLFPGENQIVQAKKVSSTGLVSGGSQ